MHLECLACMIREAVPLDPTKHLLDKVNLQNLGDIADLIYRKKHRDVPKMRRQRNMSQMNKQNKIQEKELNKMETRNLLD